MNEEDLYYDPMDENWTIQKKELDEIRFSYIERLSKALNYNYKKYIYFINELPKINDEIIKIKQDLYKLHEHQVCLKEQKCPYEDDTYSKLYSMISKQKDRKEKSTVFKVVKVIDGVSKKIIEVAPSVYEFMKKIAVKYKDVTVEGYSMAKNKVSQWVSEFSEDNTVELQGEYGPETNDSADLDPSSYILVDSDADEPNRYKSTRVKLISNDDAMVESTDGEQNSDLFQSCE